MDRKIKLLTLSCIAASLIILTGCQKEGCTDENALNYNSEATKDCCCEYASEGQLDFSVTEKVGSSDFQYNQVYETTIGDPFELDFTAFYFSNFTLLSDTGDIKLEDSYIYFKGGDGTFMLENVPTGEYNGIRFYLGVDSLTNYTTLPAEYQQDHPLSSKIPIMHWAWNTGYIFLRLDGQVDTSQPTDNAMDDELTFHIGTHAFLTPIELQKSFTISEDQTSNLNLKIDYQKFFEGIDLSEEYVTHTGDFMDLANKFKQNMASPFSLE